MTSYVALLRAVNVGKRQLKMEELRRIAGDLGLTNPTTFIASGNLLFHSAKREVALKAELEQAISTHLGASVGVIIRTAAELNKIAAASPFDVPGNRAVTIFLDAAPPADAADTARNLTNERIALGTRELFVHYPDGQGRSKLIIPAAGKGTARNMNSVAKLAELANQAR